MNSGKPCHFEFLGGSSVKRIGIWVSYKILFYGIKVI